VTAVDLRSASDWLKLPPLELTLPTTDLIVLAVGALRCSEDHALTWGVDDPWLVSVEPRAVLGTVTIRNGDNVMLYRLPRVLSEWAMDAMDSWRRGVKPYPCRVRFRLLPEGIEVSYPDGGRRRVGPSAAGSRKEGRPRRPRH